MLVMLAGLPGTGKSTLAQALVQRLPGVVLDKDLIRAALFPPRLIEYSRVQDDFVREIMLSTAAFLHVADATVRVLLDGSTFSRQYQRQRVTEFCAQLPTTWALLECVCTQQTALARLAHAAAQGTHPAANRTPELYRQVRQSWEPIDGPKMVIDTDQNLDFCVEEAVRFLAAVR